MNPLIDPGLFKPSTVTGHGGASGCPHQFPPEPIIAPDGRATWTCALCGREVTAEPWEVS